jgi:excisionase family DNA binding protein
MKVYTPEEVSGILKVSKNMVYELIGNGELYAKKVGRVYRVPAAALDYFTHNLSYHKLVVEAGKEKSKLDVPIVQSSQSKQE